MAQQLSKLSHWHNRSAYSSELKNLWVYIRNNKGPKTLPCSTPDTMLTSLLLQPYTKTCCDEFDRNCVNIAAQKLQYPQNRDYTEFPDGDPINGCAEINLYDPSLLPLSNALYSVSDMHNSASQVPRPFRWAKWVVGSTALHSINRPWQTDTRCSNTLES